MARSRWSPELGSCAESRSSARAAQHFAFWKGRAARCGDRSADRSSPRETARLLGEFLRFRHLFRNVYGFELEWPRLRGLARRVPRTWRLLKTDIERFLKFLEATAQAEER